MADIGLPQAFKVVELKTENDYTKTFTLDGSLAAEPGQFVMAWLPGLEDKPFSLAGADPIRLTVAAVGPFSRAMHRLQAGDRLWLRGPLGRGFALPAGPAGQSLLLIGGGYGVAPLLFLARRAAAPFDKLRAHPTAMIIGARSSRDLILVEAFEALGVSLWLTTEDGSRGVTGRVTDALPLALAHWPRRPAAVYACGPTGMLEAVARHSAAAGLPMQLAWEAPMRCALGLCGSCEVGQGWLACLDGPVFAFNPLAVGPGG